jgi:hypothetical protein
MCAERLVAVARGEASSEGGDGGGSGDEEGCFLSGGGFGASSAAVCESFSSVAAVSISTLGNEDGFGSREETGGGEVGCGESGVSDGGNGKSILPAMMI